MFFVQPDHHIRIGEKRYTGGERLPDLTEKQIKRFSKLNAILCIYSKYEASDPADDENPCDPQGDDIEAAADAQTNENEPENTDDPVTGEGDEENDGEQGETGEPVELPTIDATAGIVDDDEKPVKATGKRGAKGRKAGNA